MNNLPTQEFWTIERVRRWRRNTIIGVLIFLTLLVGALLAYAHYFGPRDTYAGEQQFIVNPDETFDQVSNQLYSLGFIRSRLALAIAYGRPDGGKSIRPGGYELSASMDVWSIAKILKSPPYLAWVSFRQGLRKEQIARVLTQDLSWTEAQMQEFITVDTAPSPSLVEGVYYGDTYLIPSDQTPAQVAARLRGRFNEVFAPYAAEAAKKGIPWTDVVTMASLIEREAAKGDKPLVAGILWNRIDKHMSLQVDATLQYIRGNAATGWWPVPRPADKSLVSPFNTYQHVGLPPHPIANPSLESIGAALNPKKTSCLFYLHDPKGQIHCSPTYAGQIANVNRYLR